MLNPEICAEIYQFLGTFTVFALYLQPASDKLLDILEAAFVASKKILDGLRDLQRRCLSGLIKARKKALPTSTNCEPIPSLQGDNCA